MRRVKLFNGAFHHATKQTLLSCSLRVRTTVNKQQLICIIQGFLIIAWHMLQVNSALQTSDHLLPVKVCGHQMILSLKFWNALIEHLTVVATF